MSSVEPQISRVGGLSYLRIPAEEPDRSAAFYEEVFGWVVDRAREDPSFRTAPGT